MNYCSSFKPIIAYGYTTPTKSKLSSEALMEGETFLVRSWVGIKALTEGEALLVGFWAGMSQSVECSW